MRCNQLAVQSKIEVVDVHGFGRANGASARLPSIGSARLRIFFANI